MKPEDMTGLIVFLMVASATLMVYVLISGRRSRLESRLTDLLGRDTGPQEPAMPTITVAGFARTALPKVGTALMPTDEEERTQLKSRLIHAGLYGRQAMPIFLGVKVLLMCAPTVAGFAAATLGLMPGNVGLLGGACAGIVGMIGPSFWLDRMKSKRQIRFRRGLPDALDLLVICLEGGLSLPGSLKRISSELRTAHPGLAMELNLVQREIQFGRTPGDALQQMGIRSDLEEVRSLASVITQADRFGASLVKSLRVHSDTLRLKRQQQAEENGQKAATKVLFPTLLFIFPAIFVIILGPAAIQITRTFSGLR
jgi:tight adherence protein C